MTYVPPAFDLGGVSPEELAPKNLLALEPDEAMGLMASAFAAITDRLAYLEQGIAGAGSRVRVFAIDEGTNELVLVVTYKDGTEKQATLPLT